MTVTCILGMKRYQYKIAETESFIKVRVGSGELWGGGGGGACGVEVGWFSPALKQER